MVIWQTCFIFHTYNALKKYFYFPHPRVDLYNLFPICSLLNKKLALTDLDMAAEVSNLPILKDLVKI